MKIPVTTQLDRSDFPDAPDWISKLLYPLQKFMTAVYSALTNNLSFQDNVSCVIRSFSLTAGATDDLNTLSVPWTLGRQPLNVTTTCTNGDGTYTPVYPQLSWNLINNEVRINGIKGLTPGKIYRLTVMVY
jgi:hypothetical protein